MSLSSALAKGAWQIVHELKPKLVVLWSTTGMTARIFAKARFPVPMIALSSDHRTLRRLALCYGITPREMPPPDSIGVQAAGVMTLTTCISTMEDAIAVAGNTASESSIAAAAVARMVFFTSVPHRFCPCRNCRERQGAVQRYSNSKVMDPSS